MNIHGKIAKAVIVLVHGVVGWAFCGALIGVGRTVFTMQTALVVHAIGAPIGFGLLSLLYHRVFGFTRPLITAAVFLSIVVGLDLFLVAPVFEKSYAMFASLLGTWIPFGFIFGSVWMVGAWIDRRARAKGSTAA